MVGCAVVGCHNNSEKNRSRFFRFPSDGHRRSLWVAFTKRENFVPKYSKICEAHFDTSQFEMKRQDGWKKLKWSAVPTLYTTVGDEMKKRDKLSKSRQGKLSTPAVDRSTNCAGESIIKSSGRTAKDPGYEKPALQENVKALYHKEIFKDKELLKCQLEAVADDLRRTLELLSEASKQKCQLMQLVNNLTQEEIILQRHLKKVSDKEVALKLQLKEMEGEKDCSWLAKKKIALERPLKENEELERKDEWLKMDNDHLEQTNYKVPGVFLENENRLELELSVSGDDDLLHSNSVRELQTDQRVELKLFESLVTLSSIEDMEFSHVEANNCNSVDVTGTTEAHETSTETVCKDDTRTDGANAVAMTPVDENRDSSIICDFFQDASESGSKIASQADSNRSIGLGSVHRKHVCSFCGKRFWKASSRQAHEMTHGNEFRCDFCGKVFSYRAGLINHKRTHSNEKPFACTLCDRRFKTNGSLKRHFRSHTREKHYVCSICCETFFYAHQRQVHMSVHTGERAYRCKECGRGFSSSNCLSRHALIHSGEKPFDCDVCGKKFRQRNQVKAHKETHGEKPYVCSKCGKRLGFGSFWKHMREHSGVKTVKPVVYYECAVCDKKLRTKKTLEMHTRMIHMGEAPYVCNICYKEFGKYSYFRAHKKEHVDI